MMAGMAPSRVTYMLALLALGQGTSVARQLTQGVLVSRELNVEQPPQGIRALSCLRSPRIAAMHVGGAAFEVLGGQAENGAAPAATKAIKALFIILAPCQSAPACSKAVGAAHPRRNP